MDCPTAGIVHQKEILTKYAKDRGFGNTRFFVDDGVSGTLFSRLGLDALLAEVRAGSVATVIVKDQSRIGRDVLEVGLLKRTFDENDVRFIAANASTPIRSHPTAISPPSTTNSCGTSTNRRPRSFGTFSRCA